MSIFISFLDESSSQQVLRLEKKLGEGKFEVYNVYSSSHKNNYALKIFPKNSIGNEHYKREMLLSNLSHQNIIEYIPIRCLSNEFYGLITELAKYGDLLTLIRKRGALKSELLIRTYFQQLIEGLKYIHSEGVAHLDLKLENLVIGNDFSLKIIDFDQAQPITDHQITSVGTPCCRAPEVIEENCQNLEAADIYSAGVILFGLKAGQFPFVEMDENEKISLFPYSLFLREKKEFWKEKATYLEEQETFSQDFINLLNGMLEYNPNKRFTINQIMESVWYKGPILCKESVEAELKVLI